MKKKKALVTAALLTCAFAAAAYLEGTGYALFDREKGDNLLCKIDPSCRQLTTGEIGMARKYFGATVDYQTVKIFNRALAGLFGHNKTGMTPNGNIYFADEEDRSENFAENGLLRQKNFIHEITHVAQHTGGTNVPLQALLTYLTYEFKYDDAYDYRINTAVDYAMMNLEQQAEIMEDYFILRTVFEELTTHTSNSGKKSRLAKKGGSWSSTKCEQMAAYEEKLQQRFPIKPDELCKPDLH